MTEPKLKLLPLGGLTGIGKNCTVLEYGGEILVIDAGMEFPSEEMLGVDVVIPDFTYLVENAYAESSSPTGMRTTSARCPICCNGSRRPFTPPR
jgi:mRNA degradation ribonuclease J1/J2